MPNEIPVNEWLLCSDIDNLNKKVKIQKETNLKYGYPSAPFYFAFMNEKGEWIADGRLICESYWVHLDRSPKKWCRISSSILES